MNQATPCFDDDTVVALLGGGLHGERLLAFELHADTCSRCRALVGVVAQATATIPAVDLPIEAPAPISAPRLGRYRIERELGRGTMGIVYLARDPDLRRHVALKLLHDVALDASARERLVEEARALAQLRHPNVVAVHDVVLSGEQAFLVMEWVQGTTLAAWMSAERHPRDEIVKTLVAAAHGLAAAHEAGIVHRDFKPGNVLVGDDGRVCVTDFGLAIPANAAAPGTMIGTPSYMAPELYLGLAADARSDQYAFGVAAYGAFFGVRPFQAASFPELKKRVLEGGPPVPPDDRRVPPWIRAAILRCLRHDARERYASMTDVIAALTAIRVACVSTDGDSDVHDLARAFRRELSTIEHVRVVVAPDATSARAVAELVVHTSAGADEGSLALRIEDAVGRGVWTGTFGSSADPTALTVRAAATAAAAALGLGPPRGEKFADPLLLAREASTSTGMRARCARSRCSSPRSPSTPMTPSSLVPTPLRS